ncbi:MAG: site-2 protease family protein [Candidatus Thermoplasmatota archaeon]|nr:site-2 protease family protein [Candidatus Thermoplasmatota archaeon]
MDEAMESERIGKVKSEELNYVVDTVNSYIVTYEVHVSPVSIIFFYLDSDNPDFSTKFDQLRIALVDKGYIPFVRHDGENSITVTKRPPVNYRSTKVNLVLFVLTLASTIYVGTIYSYPYARSTLMQILYGFVFFSAPLMLILGLHELGHYFVAKHYHVKSSFPFFIPFPLTIGTFGAFISLRDPIPNKRAMTEIGAAGPIVGFLTSLPLLFVADYFQSIIKPVQNISSEFILHYPIIYNLLGLHITNSGPIFPMVFSVWVGIFATAMNLLPVSQLDGGHIIRGVMGKASTYLGYVIVMALIGIAFYFNYTGWLFLAIFVMFMGVAHPPALDDYTKLRWLDILIGLFALFMFIVSFTPVPIS